MADSIGSEIGAAANASPVGTLLKIGSTFVERLIPDKNAQAEAKAQLLEMQVKGELDAQAAELQASVQALAEVNATMRAESASTHWLQWAWRPLFGITGAIVVFNNYVLLAYLQAFGVKPLVIPDITWQVILAVVGVSALSRGVEKVVSQLPFGNGSK